MPVTIDTYLEFLPLAEVKQAAKVQHNLEDEYLKTLIAGAMQAAEKFCSTDFIRKERTRVLTGLMDVSSRYSLSGRHIEVSQIKRISGTEEVLLTEESYSFLGGNEGLGGTLVFPFYTTTREGGYSYQVTYLSGYEPERYIEISDLKIALMQLVVYWYKNRESVVVGTITEGMPLSTTLVLNQYIDYA